MKKLMIAMTAIGLGFAAQAGSSWTATFEFGETYKGYTVWAVNAWNNNRINVYPSETAPSVGVGGTAYGTALASSVDTPATQISLLNDDAKGDFAAVASYYPTLNNVVVDSTGKATITSTVANEQYSWLFVLVSGLDTNGDVGYGSKYAVVQAHEVTTGVYTAGDYTASGEKIQVLTSGTIAVPEPTSALLMLLGMAGLALKRRRA